VKCGRRHEEKKEPSDAHQGEEGRILSPRLGLHCIFVFAHVVLVVHFIPPPSPLEMPTPWTSKKEFSAEAAKGA